MTNGYLEQTMSTRLIDELRDFHRFLSDKLNNGGIAWSPEEAVDEWRRLHPDAHTADEEAAAIQEALSDLADGDRGIPFDDFDRDFRKRHNLPD
jgi:hypothetical protein